MNATEELQLAELNVARARAAAVEEQRATDKAAYQQAKQDGRAVEKEYDAVLSQFSAFEAQINQRELALRVAGGELEAHNAENPEQDDFASDEEIEAWLVQRDRLRAQYFRVGVELGELTTTRDRLRLEGVKLAQRVEHYRFAVRNLKNKIDDPKLERAVRGWEGGISGVV